MCLNMATLLPLSLWLSSDEHTGELEQTYLDLKQGGTKIHKLFPVSVCLKA